MIFIFPKPARKTMTEIYYDYSDPQINTLIDTKMEMYKGELDVVRRDAVYLEYSFILPYYCEYNKLDVAKHKLYKYFCVYDGIMLYEFYNVKPV